ncbi:MAG: hypothetical protein H0S85_10230 [Desulfovibrionaceae bacterium]|jgi:hypothetical protein|nr:hypothetical protein [Desulfovibrionaceae bacterium]
MDKTPSRAIFGIAFLAVPLFLAVALSVAAFDAPAWAGTKNHKVDCITGTVRKKGDGTIVGRIYAEAKVWSGVKDTKQLAAMCNEKYPTECAEACVACSDYTFDVHGGGCWDSTGRKVVHGY